jgi:16S rRNA (guanine527-N7)-methyltransferase
MMERTLSRGERGVLHQLSQQHAAQTDAASIEALLGSYLEELLRWTRDSNLVAQADLGRLASRHVAESLAGLPIVDARAPKRLIDIGAGGGFPGLPIAILRPEIEVTLVESRRRKGLFLQRVVQVLRLPNVKVRVERAERVELEPEALADLATARAVAPLVELLPLLEPLVRPGGGALLYKGSSHESEVAAWTKAASSAWRHRATHPLADRHLFLLEFDRTPAS